VSQEQQEKEGSSAGLPTAALFVENTEEPYTSDVHFSEVDFNVENAHDLDYFKASETHRVVKAVRRSHTKRYALACRDCGFEFWADYHEGLNCPSCGTETPLIQFSPSGEKLKGEASE
jgi:rubrerythrin